MIINESKRGLYSISVKLTPQNFQLLNSFPGYTKWDGRDLLFRPSGQAVEYVHKNWPDALWQEGSCEEFYNKHFDILKTAQANREAKADDYFDDSGYEYHRPPMKHQAKAFAISRDRELFALFMEQGTGKTKVIIDTAAYLYEKGEIDCLIVVAWPNGVHRSWVDEEVPKDLPTRIDHKMFYWTAKTNKTIERQAQDLLQYDGGLKIVTYNAEAFVSPRAQKSIEQFLIQNKCLFVIDQSACIKTATAKRTKFLLKMSKLAKYKRILDGDPATEGAEELYSQMDFLDPLIIGCGNWTNFKSTYCRIGRFNEVIGYINLEELLDKIDAYCFRAREEECLDLPRRHYQRWRFDLNPKERRIYEQLKETDHATMHPACNDEGELETDLAIVKNMRLQQISSGWLKDDLTDNLLPINGKELPSRAVALKLLNEHSPGKTLIFTRFKADIKTLEDMLGAAAVSYHGGISGDDRAEAKRRFMNDPDILYFIGQPRAAGIGHTLTAARKVVFYSNEPSLRFRTECEKRAHRNGLQYTLEEGERLEIWDLMANKTTDAKGIRALRAKKDISSVIMQDPYSYFLVEDDQ